MRNLNKKTSTLLIGTACVVATALAVSLFLLFGPVLPIALGTLGTLAIGLAGIFVGIGTTLIFMIPILLIYGEAAAHGTDKDDAPDEVLEQYHMPKHDKTAVA